MLRLGHSFRVTCSGPFVREKAAQELGKDVGRTLEEFVNRFPAARDLRLLLVTCSSRAL